MFSVKSVENILIYIVLFFRKGILSGSILCSFDFANDYLLMKIKKRHEL
jgi:hypothetical protein